MGGLISDFAAWLWDVLTYIPRWVLDGLLSGLAGLIESIPVPSWVGDSVSALGAISGDVWYWVAPFQPAVGVSVIFGAYVLRFLIRRLPIVG